jgi:2,4-dienoyl-CoA reductase-like NADH-dependent reductase (Old Yellow Enzyme family)
MLCHTISTPIKLRHCTLKNRIVFGAHTANMSEGGLPLDPHFGYCRGRARGGSFRGETGKKASKATATRRMKTFPAHIQNGVIQINLGS